MPFEIGYEAAVNSVFISAFFPLTKSMPLALWRDTTYHALKWKMSASVHESADNITEGVVTFLLLVLLSGIYFPEVMDAFTLVIVGALSVPSSYCTMPTAV